MVPKCSLDIMKFTDNYIKNLQPERTWLEKIEASGLGLRVTPSGNKSWFYRFTMDGKRYKMSLGKYPAISLKDAREKLRTVQSLKEKGIHPIEHHKQQKLKQKKTVHTLILSWYTGYIEKNRKQPIQIKQQIDADIIPLLGDWELEKLKAHHITAALDKIVGRGSPVHANKVLSTLKQAFNYAVSRGEMAANPAMNIRARDIGGIEKPRDRVLSLDEIKRLWEFLDSKDHLISLQIKNALKILLLTGVRSGELRIAEWSEFDFDNSLWIIPASHTKINVTMRVHLAEPVKALLYELKQNNSSPYVLSGIDGQSILTDRALPRAVNRIQQRVGIPQWTAHDLRRTFATHLGETLNIDPVVIEKCLGHKMPKIMATYNKNEMLPQRKEALERWAELVKRLVLPQNTTSN